LMEVSAVTVPANAECTIRTIKSYDRPFSAASGNRKPVVKIASSDRNANNTNCATGNE
ncbi:peptidase U35, partial [Escherichia coli]|nr:peptidase U35 [Escherichia coli]